MGKLLTKKTAQLERSCWVRTEPPQHDAGALIIRQPITGAVQLLARPAVYRITTVLKNQKVSTNSSVDAFVTTVLSRKQTDALCSELVPVNDLRCALAGVPDQN